MNNSDFEQRVNELMQVSGVNREDAEFLVALEAEEVDGDLVDLGEET